MLVVPDAVQFLDVRKSSRRTNTKNIARRLNKCIFIFNNIGSNHVNVTNVKNEQDLFKHAVRNGNTRRKGMLVKLANLVLHMLMVENMR